MTDFSRLELSLILAFHYLDKSKNIDLFTKRFDQFFHKDITSSTLLYSVSRFKNVDPSNNVRVESDIYSDIWDEYISEDKITELKELYRSFKQGKYVDKSDVEDIPISYNLGKDQITEIIDLPQKRPDNYEVGITAYPRSRIVVTNALCNADYKCEAKCSNQLFVRKNGIDTYTEAHHLVPLCFQSFFENSLDVEANVVSLCPYCHSLLHYGSDIESVLRILYEQRITRLKKCGISVSFEELLLLYR